METSDVLNQVSAASVVQQNAAALFYCEAPERRWVTWSFNPSSTSLAVGVNSVLTAGRDMRSVSLQCL